MTLFTTALIYLVSFMPEQDRLTVSPEYLVENTQLAIEAYETAPWHDTVAQEMFLEYILPYSSVGEDVDSWRPNFRKRFLPIIQDCTTPLEAATRLNQTIWKELDVIYSTKREKHDQSPFHSMRIKVASCTGLSIILVNACRSVGVPARLVGCRWKEVSGNHTWVEVWSEGDWSFIGAFDGKKPNEGWFVENASKAIPDSPYAIHATHWKPTGRAFYNAPSIHAIDVTARYLKTMPPNLNTKPLIFDLRNETGERIVQHIVITDPDTQATLFEGKVTIIVLTLMIILPIMLKLVKLFLSK